MKFEISQPDDLMTVLNPELIRPIDYLRPAFGITVYLTCYLGLVAAISSIFSPKVSLYFLMGGLSGSLAVIPLFVAGIGIYHYSWRRRLRRDPDAFSQHIDLKIPPAHALELCLAAIGQLPKSKIEGLDERKMMIAVRCKGNFWITVDRTILLQVQPINVNESRITASSKITLTRLRTAFIKLIWGPKWYPIIFRVDVNKNKKLLDQVATYIRSIPNWDHSYSPLQIEVHDSAA